MHRRIVLTVVILILLVLILACGMSEAIAPNPHCYSQYPGCSATAAVIATAAAR